MKHVLKKLFFDAEDLLANGKVQQAIKIYEKALKEAKKDDEEEFFALNYLGRSYLELDQYGKATVYLQKSSDLAARIYGETSIQYATSLNNLAMVHSRKGDLVAAEVLFDRATSGLRLIPPSAGPRHLRTSCSEPVEVFANAADCKAKLGKVKQTWELLQCAYSEAKLTLPDSHPQRIQAAIEYASMLALLGETTEAELVRNEISGAFGLSDDPFAMLRAFSYANANITAMLQGFQSQPGGSKPTAKKQPKAAMKSAKEPRKQTRAVKPVTKNGASSSRKAPKVVLMFPDGSSKQDSVTEKGKALQIKITLKHIKPLIWRSIVVPVDCSFDQLHRRIQKAMGWGDCHLHDFQINGVRLGDPKFVDGAVDERKYTLNDFHLGVGSSFDYEYDFGDGWQHSILIERIVEAEELRTQSSVRLGEGTCPPEDSGGPHAFMSRKNRNRGR